MPEVKQVFSGDPTALHRAYADLARDCQKLESQVQKLGGGSQAGARQVERSLASMGRGVHSLGAQYITLDKIIAGVGDTFKEFQTRGLDALQSQKTFAQEQAKLIQNYAGTDESVKQNIDFAKQIVRAGFPDARMALSAITNATSAASGNDALGRQAVRIAAQYTQHTPEHLDTFAGAAVDVAQAGGVTPERSLALLMSSQSLGRINDTAGNAKNLARAIGKSVASQRGDKQEATEAAAELFSWLSTQVNDQEGERSATAMSNLSASLDDYFTKGIEKSVGGMKFRLKPKIADPGNVRDRLRALMNNPRDARQFAENYQAEAGYEQVIKRALLDPNSDQRKGFDEMVAGVSYNLEELHRRKGQLDNLTPELQLNRAQAASQGLKQLDQLASTRESMSASAGEAVRNIYRDTREHSTIAFPIASMLEESALTTQGWMGWMFGKDPNEMAVDNLKKRLDELTVRNRTLLGGRAWFDSPRTFEELSPREQSQHNRITGEIRLREGLIGQAKLGSDPAAAANAKALLEEQRKQTRLLEEQNRLLREKPSLQPGAGPAMNAQRGTHGER